MSGPSVGVTELMHTALIAVHAFARPESWNDPEDPEQAEAWTLVDAAMLAYKQWHDGERISAALNAQQGVVDASALCEQICTAIKEADDKGMADAFYMLDADDCIEIVREKFAALAAVKGVES